MKKFFILPFILLSVSHFAIAQQLKLDIANSSASKYTYFYRNALEEDKETNEKYQIGADQHRTAHLKFDFKQPTRLSLVVSPDGGYGKKAFFYEFYLSPGDDLTFSADFIKDGNGVTVTGKGRDNNQPLLAYKALTQSAIQPFYGDSIPDRVIAVINKQQLENKATLDQYLKKYRPTPDFIKSKRTDLTYYALDTYFGFKENNKYRGKDPYTRNIAQWQRMQDSLFDAVGSTLTKAAITTYKKPTAADRASIFLKSNFGQNFSALDNADALGSTNYTSLIKNFVSRYKEHLWDEAYLHPKEFYGQWYSADTAVAKKQYHDDAQNLLKEKIVNRFFTGAVAEYLIADVLRGSKEEANPKNAVAIYDRFKARFPKSKYVALYKPYIDETIAKEQMKLTDKMVFMADNGNKLNTLNEILALNKGKTLLVDMWGTWCGPCREEITKHGAAIKAHFKGKGLDYLYVANRDEGNEVNWKKLIAYFNLEGTHILSNRDLDKDIMASVKGSGYPTYFIIKKDGTYELSKAGYPMDRDKLIKQLEAALAME